MKVIEINLWDNFVNKSEVLLTNPITNLWDNFVNKSEDNSPF